MRRAFEYGGFIAAVVLVVFGIGAIWMGWNARSTVGDTLAQEQIVGTPDMTPQAIAKEAKAAGLKNVSLPTKAVAGQSINTGSEARTFAQYMRIHTLEATGGQVYSQMARYIGKDGKPTNDAKAAAIDPKTNKPVDNGARNIWVTETALTTALNTSYFAENVALFSVVMGVALLLVGGGLLVVALGPVRAMVVEDRKRQSGKPATAVPAAQA